MSDHISGPRALAEPVADITDFYAFPSPDRPGHLVLVQNTLPFAPPDARHSDGLIYRFRLKSAAPSDSAGSAPFALGEDEFTIDCLFSESGQANGNGPVEQVITVTTSTGASHTFQAGDDTNSVNGRPRVFAGVRWDPFFLDAPAALKTIATQRLAFTDPGAIYLDGKNVLSLVVEIDSASLPNGPGTYAAITETLTRGKFPVRIERVGRPEMKNLILAAKQFDKVNRDLEIRDIYNMENAFHLAEAYQGAYRARLDANLSAWDAIDGKVDSPLDENGRHPFSELLLADYLIVDTSRPYKESGAYFEIERAVAEGRNHTTCGGRALNDDVMDTIFTLLVNGGNGPTIRDGVDQSTRPATQVFPYLSPANPNPPQQPEHH